MGSLCSELMNHRQDEYGASFENRVRYALEVVTALKEAAPDLILEYKLPIITVNPDGSLRGKGGLIPEEAKKFAVLLEKAGVDMIQAAQANHTGNMGDTIPPMGTVPYNWILPIAAQIKKLVSIPPVPYSLTMAGQFPARFAQYHLCLIWPSGGSPTRFA